METSILNNYKTAASVWKSAISLAKKETKENVSLYELAEKVENYILENDCGLAFPINLSINEQAAHYTPNWNKEEDYNLKSSDLLKIDIGVHKEGYICDGAISINLDNTHALQIEANELALDNAISVAKFGISADKIGKEIEDTLKEKGFNPVYNLGGHGLSKFEVHTYPSIPNHSMGSRDILEEGAVAIEPFSSTGKGRVSEDNVVDIFELIEGKNSRNNNSRKLISTAKNYNGLPFSERTLKKDSKLEDFGFNMGLRDLMKNEIFKTYPGLKEAKGEYVTQVEKSIIVLEDKIIVLGE
jgi:methionyl aminopeptidase